MRLRLARVYEQRYMWSAAIRQYGVVIEERPEAIDLYLRMAEAYKWRTEYDTALDYLGRGLSHASNDDQRIDLLEAAIAVDGASVGINKPLSPAGLDARLDLAHVYIDQGETGLAAGQLDEVVADDPDYRADDVAALRAQIARSTVDSTSPGEVQTPSDGM